MKQLALIAVMTIASATAMAQTSTGNTATTSGKTAQEANASKSGSKAADAGQANANAQGATTTMGAGTKAGRWAAMDANKDGMVSQEEYMAFHTGRWSKMKQTNGMVSMADMEAAMSGGTAGGPN